MNQALKNTALFIRDLLSYDEQLIRIGRGNFNQTDFELNYIGVDIVGTAARMSSSETFNNEVLTYSQQWRAPVVASFYGIDAHANAARLTLLTNSQAAFELQKTLGINIYNVSQIIDVKQLTGDQFGNRLDISFNVIYNISEDVATLRIDTAKLNIRTEKEELLVQI